MAGQGSFLDENKEVLSYIRAGAGAGLRGEHGFKGPSVSVSLFLTHRSLKYEIPGVKHLVLPQSDKNQVRR